jgi:hypothetical protein
VQESNFFGRYPKRVIEKLQIELINEHIVLPYRKKEEKRKCE